MMYIDVTWSTYTDLDVLQEKKGRRLMECRFEQAYVRFLGRLHKIHSVEREASQKIYVVRAKIDQKVWTKIDKAAQNRENKNGNSRSQNSIMLDD